jgi:large subunit ribosomal protein L14
MIQPYSRLKVADNTGAKEVMCIRVLKGRKQKRAVLGDTIVISVKKATPRATAKKKAVSKAVIVRQKSPFQRDDGSVIKFDDNAVVLINDDGTPKGTRVLGPVSKEIRAKGFMKIVSMAPEVV